MLHTCRHVPLHHTKLTGSLDAVTSVQWSLTVRAPNVRINLLTVKIQYDCFSVPEFGLEFEGQLAVCQIINSLEGTSIGI